MVQKRDSNSHCKDLTANICHSWLITTKLVLLWNVKVSRIEMVYELLRNPATPTLSPMGSFGTRAGSWVMTLKLIRYPCVMGVSSPKHGGWHTHQLAPSPRATREGDLFPWLFKIFSGQVVKMMAWTQETSVNRKALFLNVCNDSCKENQWKFLREKYHKSFQWVLTH